MTLIGIGKFAPTVKPDASVGSQAPQIRCRLGGHACPEYADPACCISCIAQRFTAWPTWRNGAVTSTPYSIRRQQARGELGAQFIGGDDIGCRALKGRELTEDLIHGRVHPQQ